MFLDIEKIDNKILLQCFSDSYHEQNLSWILEKFEKKVFVTSSRLSLEHSMFLWNTVSPMLLMTQMYIVLA